MLKFFNKLMKRLFYKEIVIIIYGGSKGGSSHHSINHRCYWFYERKSNVIGSFLVDYAKKNTHIVVTKVQIF